MLQLTAPGFGPGALKLTSRFGSATGSGCSSMRSNIEKIAAFAPMPSASDTMATMVTNGVLKSVRKANLKGVIVGTHFFPLAAGPHPRRVLSLIPRLGFTVLGSGWPQAPAALLVTQRAHRIHLRRTVRGNEPGAEGDH